MPNLLTLLNQLRRADWKTASDSLHHIAEDAENRRLDDPANPAQVDALVRLARGRMQPQAPAGERFYKPRIR